MVKINSLYKLIKKTSQQRGRPLKIICDWDEVIQPINPKIWYEIGKRLGRNKNNSLPFSEWFNYYWKNARVHYEGACPWTMYTTIKEVEEIRDNKEQFEELVRKPFFEIMNSPDYYEKAPFLSCAKDLARGLKEGIIEELSFISTTAGLDDRKRRQCEKFFPSCSIELKSQGKSSPQKGDFSRGEPKWKWIKDNHPDFDIFIDDSPAIIKETKKEFGPEKLYVMTDYPIVEEVRGENVCRILSIPLSDREFKEFIQYVEDYKTLRDCCSSECFQDVRNLLHG